MILNGIFLGDDEYVFGSTPTGDTVSRVRPDGTGEFVDGGTAAAVIEADDGARQGRFRRVAARRGPAGVAG